MTDQQIMTLIIGIEIPIGALIYSNSRIADAKEVLKSQMDIHFKSLQSEIIAIRAHVDIHNEKISNQIRELKDAIHIHEVEHHNK